MQKELINMTNEEAEEAMAQFFVMTSDCVGCLMEDVCTETKDCYDVRLKLIRCGFDKKKVQAEMIKESEEY